MKTRTRTVIALSLLVCLLLPPVPLPAVQAAESHPGDPGWPRTYPLAKGGSALVYAPQVASWEGKKRLVAWAAVSYEAKGAKEPALGTIKIESDTSVAVDDRLVHFDPFRITESNFPSLPREEGRELVGELQKAIPEEEKVIALDRVLAGIDKSQIISKETAGLRSDPPRIFHSTRLAVLVNFDGKPVWSPVKDVDLKFAVNTNWDVFEQEASKTFYLRDEDSWLQASAVEGPWKPAGPLPGSFGKLPADDNWKDVKANLPGRALTAETAPVVFVSTTPAELILMAGEPKYEPVPGTRLLWVANTESDLFRLGESGPFYFLVAGRWFTAPGLDGPWTFATPSLPEDFKKIPVEHERSRVLASVPGTDQAAEAVLLAEVPRTARVNRKEIKAPEVSYQGDPKFERIDGTSLARAVNTDKDVIQDGAVYYLCFEGVWFTGKSAAGPWEVATSVPPEVYKIPASSPIHHVTYVTVTDDDPSDDWVTFAYMAGYTGLMVAWGCAVWGTGWYYPPYVWYGGLYPAYFWYPPTYGFGAWYNPWTGAYGRGASVYGPYGGAGVAASYNPRTGTYARGAAVYGPYNARGVAEAWNPRTGTYARTRQGANVYGNWGSTYVQRGDDWMRTSHVTNAATGATTRVTRGDQGGGVVTRRGPENQGFVARGPGGDVYAGHDGNVYRRTEDGNWQQKVGGNGSTRWSPADAQSRGQLDRDRTARLDGEQRARDAASFRQSPNRSFAGSFRPGARGGGMRRR